MTNLLLLLLHCSNILGEFVSVAGVSLTEHFYIAVLASPSLSRRLQLRLWCWLVRSQVKQVSSAGYGRVEPLQDVSVSSVMILGGFNPWKDICHLGSSYQTALKLGKAKRNVGNHQPLSIQQTFPGAASCDNNATRIYTFSNARVLSGLSQRLSGYLVIMTRMTSAGNPKHQSRTTQTRQE